MIRCKDVTDVWSVWCTISWNWRYTQVPVSDRSANMLLVSRIPTIHQLFHTSTRCADHPKSLSVGFQHWCHHVALLSNLFKYIFWGTRHDEACCLLAGVWRSVRWESLWPGGRSTCNLQNHLCIVNQIGTQQFFPFYFQGFWTVSFF